MNVRPTVLLFDVDGTLVTTPGCGRRALERAFTARHGRSTVLRDVRLDGMTDRAIVRAGLTAIGEPATDTAIDALIAVYVPLLEEEVAQTPELRLHAGVHDVLAATTARSHVAVGLGTGNIRAGARAKLTPLGIFDRFRFGGFGCDHEEREHILRIGAERGAATLGCALSACRVVVIGDTPRDVVAAHAIRAEAIAVASARFGQAELHAAGASRVFADLAEPDVLATLLGDG